MGTLSRHVVLQWTLANEFVALCVSSTVLLSTNSRTTADCAASRREAMKSVPTVWTAERQKELQLDHEHRQSRWSASIKLYSVAATNVCVSMHAVSRLFEVTDALPCTLTQRHGHAQKEEKKIYEWGTTKRQASKLLNLLLVL